MDEPTVITPTALITLIVSSTWGTELARRASFRYARPRREGNLFEARRTRNGVVVKVFVDPLTQPPHIVKPVLNRACRAAYTLVHDLTSASAIQEMH